MHVYSDCDVCFELNAAATALSVAAAGVWRQTIERAPSAS